jgi:hypothetical protein
MVAFGSSQCRTRDTSIVGPRGEFDTRNHFHIFVDDNNFILTQSLTIGQRGDFAVIKIIKDFAGVKAIFLVIHIASARQSLAMVHL